ncbi:type II toxin-antitoxin system VapC family toxin [Rhodohalobacter sp. 8-1]|uniref:type II toxin-antitoxin system VapC family toxin n=1 Tax=Rhodohalobacter sp. 8-1 TaxID=3131972 RepID=UPI0030ED5340
MIILDTHIWLWWLLGDGNLTHRERDVLDRKAAKKELCISWVNIWETEMLERKGRIQLYPDFSSWILQATKPQIVSVLPADIKLVVAQRQLPESFHGDPADRLITATSILSGYPLATHDKRIRSSGCCRIWEP